MPGVRVGLKDLHYATLTKDDDTGITYGAPKRIAGAINATITPNSESATLYADDGAAETDTALGEIEVELEVKDLPLSVQADLLGHTVTNGVMIKNTNDNAPYVAVGFRAKKSNGKYRYVWLYKGKFALPEEEYQTKGDSPEFQTPTISGTFVKREKDGNWQAVGDEDETGFTAGPNWFTAVYEQPPVI